MIWLWMAALVVVGVAPLIIVWGRGGAMRYRRETAMELHRAQLAEIDRDRAEGRLAEADYAGAKLEVQRRLLSADALPEPEAEKKSPVVVIGALVLVPLAAVLLVLPDLIRIIPSEPHAAVLRAESAARRQDDMLVARLQQKLAQMPPDAAQARQGYLLLGQALVAQHQLAQAAKAWRIALHDRFDPALAAETAEAETEAAGHVTPDAAELFHQALDKAPDNAPWRSLAERRLREAAVSLPARPLPKSQGSASSTP